MSISCIDFFFFHNFLLKFKFFFGEGKVLLNMSEFKTIEKKYKVSVKLTLFLACQKEPSKSSKNEQRNTVNGPGCN